MGPLEGLRVGAVVLAAGGIARVADAGLARVVRGDGLALAGVE